ncbi:MAG: VWA domain-containing protein [Planctomycetota bacterium]
MGTFTFEIPLLAGLAAVVPLAPLLVRLIAHRRAPGSLPLHILAALCASLLLLALARPGLEDREPKPSLVVFAFDGSESVPPSEKERALKEAQPLARRLALSGVQIQCLVFDAQSRFIPVDPWPTADALAPPSPPPEPKRTSRLMPALLDALGALPPDGRGRVFLYSDGRFSDLPEPDALPRGMPVYAFPLKPEGRAEVILPSLALAPPLEEGTPTIATVEVQSNTPGEGTVTLYRNGKKIASRTVRVETREPTRISFPGLQFPRGTHRLSARFEGGGESLPDAEPVFVDVSVEGPPKVYLIDSDPPRGLPVLKALLAQGIDLTAAKWGNGESPESFEKYDAFILIAPPHSAAQGPFPARLARYIAGGGGMILVADETGFGPEFRKSALAAAVPVHPPDAYVPPPPPDPEPKEEDPEPPPPPPEPPPPDPEPPVKGEDPPTERKTVEIGSVALVFLIDKSGSMTGKKIRLAKEAAIAAAKEIGESNTLGVLAFDTEATWLVPLTSASNQEWIVDRVSRLQAGGGTNIFPALVKSFQALKEVPARIRHVILISDGYNKTLEDFKGIVSKMAEKGITLSTIGVGEQFDTRLLSSLTYWAGQEKGRFDYTRDFSRIPRLVIQQTRWALGKPDDPEPKEETPPPPPPEPPPLDPTPPEEIPEDPLEEEPKEAPKVPLHLSLPHPSPPFRGMKAGDIPPIYGHRNCRLGPLADVLASAPDKTPVIVLGEHGVGKVLYVGTALSGNWGADWQAWRDFPKWIGQALRWVKRRPEDPLPPRVHFSPTRMGILEILVQADPAAPAPESPPQLTLKHEKEAAGESLPVLRASIHRYASRVEICRIQPSSTLRVEFPPGSGSVPLETEVPVPLPLPFEREFREPDLDVLDRVAKITGGQLSPTLTLASRYPPSLRKTWVPLGWIPLIAVLALLPVAALFRRFRSV